MEPNGTAARPWEDATAATHTKQPTYSVYCTNRHFCNSSGIVLQPTPLIIEIVRSLANARAWFHDGFRKAHQDMGAKANLRADAYGILAELLVYGALEANGYSPEGIALFRSQPPTGPDFRLGPKRYDVKAVLPRSSFLMVNEQARIEKAAEIDAYIPVAFCPPGCAVVYAPISTDEIGRWELRHGHSPYRSEAITRLKPLACWQDLIAWVAR